MSDVTVNNVCTKYNRAIRKLFNLPFRTHRYLLSPLTCSPPLLSQLNSRFYKLYQTMKVSQNCVIRNSFHVLSNDPRSILNSYITVHSKLSVPDCSNADAIESRIPLIIDIYNSRTCQILAHVYYLPMKLTISSKKFAPIECSFFSLFSLSTVIYVFSSSIFFPCALLLHHNDFHVCE